MRRTPSSGVYTTTRLNLTCITMLSREVDTPMTVTHTWRGPSGSISPYSSRPRVSNVTQTGQVYWSSIYFSSGIRASDSGNYFCISNTTSASSYIVTSGSVLGVVTYVSVGKKSGMYYYIANLVRCLKSNMAKVTAHCFSSSQGCDWHQLHSTWGGIPTTILQSSISCHPDLQSCGCKWSNKIPLEFNM